MQKTILITGCSSGIGKALAQQFAHLGQCVYASARRPEQLADLAALGIRTLALDVTQPQAIDAALDQIAADGVHLDMLINNAGYAAMGPLLEMPTERLAQQFATNVYAPLALTQAVAHGMIQRRQGCIVNIGSVSGVLSTPFAGAYCASKAALNSFSDTLRMELAPFGIHVVGVEPGAIASQFGQTASQQLADTQLYAPLAKHIQDRANASQQQPTSAAEFAEQLCPRLLKPKPDPRIRIGKGSRVLPLLARLPLAWRDALLQKKFGLRDWHP